MHRLITLLADSGDSKSAENRMSDANLACRKLAVSHPVLLLRCSSLHSCYLIILRTTLTLVHHTTHYAQKNLRVNEMLGHRSSVRGLKRTKRPTQAGRSPSRHLPMIAALLHGRIHLNFQEFRQQNHLTFFSDVLAILELLQPLVFHPDHQRALQDSLLSFIQVLQVGQNIVCRVLSLLRFRLGSFFLIRGESLIKLFVCEDAFEHALNRKNCGEYFRNAELRAYSTCCYTSDSSGSYDSR